MNEPKLIAVDGPLRGRLFPLGAGERFMGRGPDNDIVLPDSSASRRHCSVTQQPDGTFVIRDLESHNGTFVNGLPVSERQLTASDEIRICRSRFVFELEASDAGESMLHVQEGDDSSGTIVRLRRDGSLYLRPEEVLGMPAGQARAARAFRTLLNISGVTHGSQGLRELASQILAALFESVPGERGAVLLSRGAMDDTPLVFGWMRDGGRAADVAISRTVLERVRREGMALLSNSGSLSVLAVPLSHRNAPIGLLYLESADPRVRFDEDNLQLATAAGFIASRALADALEFERLRTENVQLRAESEARHEMVGESAAAHELYRLISRVSAADSTVLVTGETGTGKELVARALHRNSARARGPFVAINCAALPENLLESELFGHEKGAFTGAHAMKRGKIEVACGGTLFLDEIGEMAPGLQSRLLRVLQEREFERVGGTAALKANVRVIAATNRDLAERIRAGAFREDLFYRLNVIAILVPPLRDRHEDIAPLARHFIERFRRRAATPVRDISPEALACLVQYHWPGNIRELENTIERTLVLGSTPLILPEDLPENVLDSAAPALPAGGFQRSLQDQKRQMVLAALRETAGSFTEAARKLGIHPNSLHRLIRNLGIRAEIDRALA